MHRSDKMTPVEREAARILLFSGIGLMLASKIMGVNPEAMRRIRRRSDGKTADLFGPEHEALSMAELGIISDERLIFLHFASTAVAMLYARYAQLDRMLTDSHALAFARALTAATRALKGAVAAAATEIGEVPARA
jgi:hypothetical protein